MVAGMARMVAVGVLQAMVRGAAAGGGGGWHSLGYSHLRSSGKHK